MPALPQATTLTQVQRDDSEAKQRPLDWGLFRRLWGYTAPHRLLRGWLLVCVVLRSIQTPAMAWAIAAIINGPIAGRDWQGLWMGTTGFLLLAIVTYVTFHFRMRLALELGERVVQDLRRDIFAQLQRMSMRFYDRTKLGRIISRVTSDAEAIRMGIQDALFITMVNALAMLVAASVMAWYDFPLFCMVLAMSPLLWWINHWFGKRIGQAWRDVQESFSRVTATLAESVNGIRVTQGFVRQDVNARLFRELIEDHSNYNIRIANLAGIHIPLMELNSQFFISVLLVLGSWQVLHSGFFAGDSGSEANYDALVVFLFMVPQFFGPIRLLAQQYNTALTAMAGAERVFTLLDTQPEQLDDPDAIDPATLRGEVVFDRVCFGYDPKRQVLHEVSFTAHAGQTIALVGHTGSGKSTIIKLISKFYAPTAGTLTIDGIPIRKLQSDALMRRLGIVLQQNFLFTGSVLENIRVGRPDATDADVYEVAKHLDCIDILEALPEGLNTRVGEKGTALSLGQRQLVCFCRALLADPAILILDEATSSVDTMTEARIQKALSVLLAGRTSFVVAHRLSTIRHADCVLVLDHGRLIEQGTHNALLATGGAYAQLYRQFIHASEA